MRSGRSGAEGRAIFAQRNDIALAIIDVVMETERAGLDLVGYLRDEKKVASFKLPERIMMVDELPRNPVGKVLKRNLREQIQTLADAATQKG